MTKTTLIPVGPQHPVFLEPLNISLKLKEETVVGAEINYGFNHRGLEKAMAADFRRTIYMCERICGICSFYHSTAYCQSMESLFKVEVPERARFIRLVMMECQRLTSHTLALGHTAEAMGYESLFMQLFREREALMRLVNDISGNRVHYSINTIGGVRRDIPMEKQKEMLSVLDGLETRFAKLAKVFKDDRTIKERTIGKGVLTKEMAKKYCVVGPVARASGIPEDIRTSYCRDLDFQPIVRDEGDSYARSMVRVDETFQSIQLIRKALTMLPEGPLEVPVKGNPSGEAFIRLEAPRGEVIYYVKAKGTVDLERIKVKTPAFVNVAALSAMVPGCEMPDIPVITVSVDPCICCTER
ncbi:MAG: F(420)H(2) dehydrogenase subunit D [Methanomassiliicoccales archaeon PtaU1.Bin124]|nr:MAG: F(420)H(2) dehydrogenase subunit D [Methanomassiliicoccales archaeon PtaU1.Bin124]